MSPRLIFTCWLNFIMMASVAIAQKEELSKYIYQIRARADTVTYLQTGFRKAGTKGIITALHGVVAARSLSAMNDKDVLTGLRIARVDIAKDLAILSSPELDKLGDDGLVSKGALEIVPEGKLRALGFPLGIKYHDQPLSVGNPAVKRLSNFIPPDSRKVFEERLSPYSGIDVMNIVGSLVKGLSGAPILDSNNLLLGVGNGGLLGGAAGISWAIPIDDVEWEEFSTPEIEGRIRRLKKYATHELFDLQIEPNSKKAASLVGIWIGQTLRTEPKYEGPYETKELQFIISQSLDGAIKVSVFWEEFILNPPYPRRVVWKGIKFLSERVWSKTEFRIDGWEDAELTNDSKEILIQHPDHTRYNLRFKIVGDAIVGKMYEAHGVDGGGLRLVEFGDIRLNRVKE